MSDDFNEATINASLQIIQKDIENEATINASLQIIQKDIEAIKLALEKLEHIRKNAYKHSRLIRNILIVLGFLVVTFSLILAFHGSLPISDNHYTVLVFFNCLFGCSIAYIAMRFNPDKLRLKNIHIHNIILFILGFLVVTFSLISNNHYTTFLALFNCFLGYSIAYIARRFNLEEFRSKNNDLRELISNNEISYIQYEEELKQINKPIPIETDQKLGLCEPLKSRVKSTKKTLIDKLMEHEEEINSI